MERARRLAEFLRARRLVTTLEQVGLELGGPRRTPGLRREEVAMLAGMSTDYYVRLEQGREVNPSDQVLGALARVYGLDAEATEHLFALAHPRVRRQLTDEVHPNVLHLLACFEHSPAYVVNHRLDVLAWNELADALYDGLAHRDNLLRLAVLDPERDEFYRDWELDTRSKVAHLRAAAGAHDDDPLLRELVEELSEASEDFRRMWERHDVAGRTRAPVRFHHREAGDLEATMEVMSLDASPGQKLVLFQVDAGSPSEEMLERLRRAARARREATTGRTPPAGPRRAITYGR